MNAEQHAVLRTVAQWERAHVVGGLTPQARMDLYELIYDQRAKAIFKFVRMGLQQPSAYEMVRVMEQEILTPYPTEGEH